MRMRLLLGNLQALGHEVQVVDVGEPHPRGIALRRRAVLAVPHGQLPFVIRIGDHGIGQRSVQMRVNRSVLVAGVVAVALGVVQVVHLDRAVGAPTPHDRVAELVLVDVIPACALRRHLDAQLVHLVGELHGDGLAHRVGGGIVQVERGSHAVLDAHTVGAGHPTRLVEQGLCARKVLFALHGIGRPGHVVTDAVGDLAIAVQHVVDERLALHAVVDGATQRQVLRDRVAGGILLARLLPGSARGDGGQGDAARVDGSAVQQVIALRLLVGEGCRRERNVHLAGTGGRQAGVLLHEHHHDALDLRRLAVVVGVGLQDDLLAAVPLLEHVAAAAHRVAAVVGIMAAIRHDADDRQRVQQRVERLVQMDLAGLVVNGNGLVDHGQVALAGLVVGNAVDGIGHVMGGNRLAVGELGVGADGERPGQAVIAARISRCQVVLEAHVGLRGQKRGLDERLVHVLAAAPGNERVEAGIGLAAHRHGNGDLRGMLPASGGAGARVGAAGAGAQHAAEAHCSGAYARHLQKRTPGEALHQEILSSTRRRRATSAISLRACPVLRGINP